MYLSIYILGEVFGVELAIQFNCQTERAPPIVIKCIEAVEQKGLSTYMYMYIHVYTIHVHVHVHVYTFIYMYIHVYMYTSHTLIKTIPVIHQSFDF